MSADITQWPTPPAPGTPEGRDAALGHDRERQGEQGWKVLADVEAFLSDRVIYPGRDELTAHVLWIAHTWFMNVWDSTPRLAFLSPEPGSGKSRALEVTAPLVPNPVHAVNATPAYLFRKVADQDARPTILFDEVDTIFGPKAKDNEELRGMLNAGHRRGAVAGRCVVRGKDVFTEELPAYAAVALAGLDDLPDTIRSRSVIVRMRRRKPTEPKPIPWRGRDGNSPAVVALRERLGRWADSVRGDLGDVWPEMPEGVEDRDADVWEALVTVADAAGGAWPERSRECAVRMVGKSHDKAPTLGVLLLRDIRGVIREEDVITTEDLLDRLNGLEESPWGNLRGEPLDARGLSRRLGKYSIKPTTVRIGARIAKGYKRTDFADPWERYLTAPRTEDDTSGLSRNSVTSVTALQGTDPSCNAVTDVTDLEGGRRESSPTSVPPVQSVSPDTPKREPARAPAVRERTNTVPDTPEGDTEMTASMFPPCQAPGCTQDLWSPESQRLGYCSKHRHLSEGEAS
jgi:hypothetical protein